MAERDEEIEAEMARMDGNVARAEARVRPEDELHAGAFLHEPGTDPVGVLLEPVRELDEDELRILSLDILDRFL